MKYLIIGCVACIALFKYGNDVLFPAKPSALFSSVASALKVLKPDPWSLERRSYRCYEPDYTDSSYLPHEQVKRVCVLVRVAP
jgi:hypothetical protein